MKLSNILQSMLIASVILLPVSAVAEANSISKLSNQSKQDAFLGFYLVRDKIIGENECVKVNGNEKLNPGDSAELEIKKGCQWGVVQYKVFSVKDNKSMGVVLAHSFHNGIFSIEMTSLCKGSDCNFYGLNLNQTGNK